MNAVLYFFRVTSSLNANVKLNAGYIMKSVKLLNELFKSLEMPVLEIDCIDPFNQEYEGFDFSVSQIRYRSRLAKKTPKKAGYFLAIWEKDLANKNIPFSAEAFPDYLIVNIIDGKRKGQFIFPKVLLKQQGILSSPTKLGKMAFRVYAPWDQDLNVSAMKTAQWQTPCFIELPAESFKRDNLRNVYR